MVLRVVLACSILEFGLAVLDELVQERVCTQIVRSFQVDLCVRFAFEVWEVVEQREEHFESIFVRFLRSCACVLVPLLILLEGVCVVVFEGLTEHFPDLVGLDVLDRGSEVMCLLREDVVVLGRHTCAALAAAEL